MKKYFVLALLSAIVGSLNAQTNTFPTSGNVGIGTLSPLALLDVNGNIQVSNSGIPMGLITELGGTTSPLINFDVNFRSYTTNTNYVGASFRIDSRASFPLFQWNSRLPGHNDEALLMTLSSTGNLGVSAFAPMSKFQVNEGYTKLSVGDAYGNLNNGTSYIGFNASKSGNNWVMESDNENNGGGVIYSSVLGDLYFATIGSNNGSTTQMLSDDDIRSRINFRISPDGISHARQLIVESANWPDYVFKPTYTLAPLSEIKTYINQNHHLPEMPSAAEVEMDGLNVGEMNKLLLKKVEELTLYLIEKDIQLKEVKERLKKLESK